MVYWHSLQMLPPAGMSATDLVCFVGSCLLLEMVVGRYNFVTNLVGLVSAKLVKVVAPVAAAAVLPAGVDNSAAASSSSL